MYSSPSSTSLAALVLLLSSTASAYTLNNVTVGSQDPSILYYPPCILRSFSACWNGAWYKTDDPSFFNGSAMAAGNPSAAFQGVEPYFAYTFRGSALYMYQWMNSSTAQQLQYYDNDRTPLLDLVKEFPQFATSSNLTSVLAWSLEGLDPLKEHTVGIQHLTRDDGSKNELLIFDYMVVTMTTLEPGDIPNKGKLSGGAIAGAVIAALVGLGGIIAGFFWFRSWCRRRAAKKGTKGKWNWEGSLVKPSTLRFVDPSSEIEASERMAREGRIEEEREGKVGSLA